MSFDSFDEKESPPKSSKPIKDHQIKEFLYFLKFLIIINDN